MRKVKYYQLSKDEKIELVKDLAEYMAVSVDKLMSLYIGFGDKFFMLVYMMAGDDFKVPGYKRLNKMVEDVKMRLDGELGD
jgi:hypothetical protein